jgi:L-ribulose-5-phosphate 3-epimerase
MVNSTSPHTRRTALCTAAAALGSLAVGAALADSPSVSSLPPRPVSPRIRFGVSTYSFWQFNGEPPSIEACIDRAAEMGFDGCEILHRQMGENQSNGRLQQLKQRAFRQGLDLCGFSTHQSFVKPDPAERQQNVDDTIRQIELAYALGIPTIRVNTGRWGTSKDFDELMANKGIEPRLPGYTDEDGFGWVIGSLEKCLKKAEECGVVMGLENHWGLGRDAAGVLRVIDAIHSPWLQATLDTGNFLENQYEQYAQLAPRAVLVQAKTYHGGGKWYTLDIDYTRVAQILKAANYSGYISLEMEGKADPSVAVPQSLSDLRTAFGGA